MLTLAIFLSLSFFVFGETKKIVGKKIPIGIGFGVSTSADVKKYVSLGVDAVIVGSANLKIIENTPPSKLQRKITLYTKKLKKSTRVNY